MKDHTIDDIRTVRPRLWISDCSLDYSVKISGQPAVQSGRGSD